MERIYDVDWHRTFMPETPLLEIVLRGTLTYLALILLFRIVLKREPGTIAITDLLVVVLVADAAQNAMADDYHSVTDGIALVGTIIFWSYTLNWLGYHFPLVERIVHPPKLPLIRDGRLIRKNMRTELITEEELMSQLREQGVEDPSAVKVAYMEGDGRISVITDGKEARGAPDANVR